MAKLPSDNYDIGEFIGSGGFASVFRGRCRADGTEVAIKAVDKAALGLQMHKIRNEIMIQGAVSHENIVKLHGTFENESTVFLVLEYCNGGNLYRFLKKNGPLDEKMAVIITLQILRAINCLHSAGIVHRDLKLSNVLISDCETMRVKICDFGLAVRLEHPDEERFTMCGTPNYIAPEIAGQHSYGFPVDLWAVGCLFYCMTTGESPFEDCDVAATLKRIMSGSFVEPRRLSSGALDFLKCLLNKVAFKYFVMHVYPKH